MCFFYSNLLKSAGEIEQDSKYTARSTNGKPIGVPYCAASVSRAFRTDSAGTLFQPKKHKGLSSLMNGTTFVSEEEEMEDINFLLSEPSSEDEGDREIL